MIFLELNFEDLPSRAISLDYIVQIRENEDDVLLTLTTGEEISIRYDYDRLIADLFSDREYKEYDLITVEEIGKGGFLDDDGNIREDLF